MSDDLPPNDSVPAFKPLVSLFSNAFENLPTDIPAEQFINDIKSNQHKALVETIRTRFKTAIGRGVDYKNAKRVVDSQKKKLPAVSFAGVLPMRDKNATPKFTGLMQTDLDLLGDKLAEIRGTLQKDPHVFALFVSPTGEGLKTIFRVPVCSSGGQYAAACSAIAKHVKFLTGADIDKLEDFTRLCFASHDPDAYLNPNAIECPVDFTIPPEPPPKPAPAPARSTQTVRPDSRRAIAIRILGEVKWENDNLGDCHCPGEAKHTTGEKARECQIHLDKVPTVHCLHTTCKPDVDDVNRRLRSEIGKAEYVPSPNFRATRAAAEYFGDSGVEENRNGATLPDIVDSVAFMAAPHPAPPELIAGILHKGSKLSVSGNSKAYKTWLYADLAVSISHGTPWLGFQTALGKVLYLNFEVQDFAWRDRIHRICESKGTLLQPGRLHFWNLRGKARSFRELIPLIISRAKDEGYALIIIDPLYKLLGGAEENSATDIAELLNAFERLSVEAGASVAYAHHFAKGNAASKEAIDRQGGSGVFGRDPDSLLVFTSHEEPKAFTVEPILRNFAPVEPFVVRWNYPLMHRDLDLDPAKLRKLAGRTKEHFSDDLLTLLPDTGFTSAEWLKSALQSGLSRASFFRLRKDLENDRKILISQINAKWMKIAPPNTYPVS